MKILLTADPELPVPPIHYGGIERVVQLLADGLVERGHDVTLVAHHGSRTKARLVPFDDVDWRTAIGALRHMALVSKTALTGRFDVVHSHSRIAYLTPILPTRTPKLMSYQRQVTPRSIRWARRLGGRSIEFSAVSRAMIADVLDLAPWHVVYNGVPVDKFLFQGVVAPDAPLVFLGRIEPIKGAHLAIDVAKACGCRLVIAGNIPEEHRAYFETEVSPHLDGTQISYVGPVDDVQKNALLGDAAAFLMPILWEEPFGIVMAEALACGTPVIGLRRGSVPEVVSDGLTGFICQNVSDMAARVGDLGRIDRAACRRRAERMFSERNVVEGFLATYQRLVEMRERRSRDQPR